MITSRYYIKLYVKTKKKLAYTTRPVCTSNLIPTYLGFPNFESPIMDRFFTMYEQNQHY